MCVPTGASTMLLQHLEFLPWSPTRAQLGGGAPFCDIYPGLPAQGTDGSK